MTIGPLEIGEIKAIRFDFTAEAGVNAILSLPSVTCVVVYGTDPAASSVCSGAPTIDGLFVVQKVIPGVAGCSYKLKAFATDDSGLRHGISAKLDVVTG